MNETNIKNKCYGTENYMYTKNDLKKNLEQMGLEHTDSLLIHSSMKSIGEVEGGADTVVDAFMEYFEDGLFMTPAHTWAQMSEEHNRFDPENEPACVGIIPNIFMKRAGVVRSLHPTHSMAAYGKGIRAGCAAWKYLEGEENATTPCMPGGAWDRLKDINAKILLIGVNHVKNTYIHSVEEVLGVPERLTDKPVHFEIKMKDGSIKGVDVKRHYNRNTEHISESFEKLREAYFEEGAAKKVEFGDAQCILCDAKRIFEVTKRVLSHEINCLIDREEIPREWWKQENNVIN